MKIANFNNSISNSLCDYVFYPSKSLIVIAYLLCAVLLKHIVNWTLALATFNAFFRKKEVDIIVYLGRIGIGILEYVISIHVEPLVLPVFTTAGW